MKIFKKINQFDIDFLAILKCEFCGNKIKDCGQNTKRFYERVLPWLDCKKCGKCTRMEKIKSGGKI